MRKFLFLGVFLLGAIFAPFSVRAVDNPQTSSISISASVESTSKAVRAVSGNYLNKSGIIIFRGYAYPNAILSLTRDNLVILNQSAKADASFEISLGQLELGESVFTLSAKEISSGDVSSILKFNLKIERGINLVIDHIFFPPTLHSNYSEVIKGDEIIFFGRTAPEARVDLFLEPSLEKLDTLADQNGFWRIPYDSSNLPLGEEAVQAKATSEGMYSIYSGYLYFKVGDKRVKAPSNQVKPEEVEISLFPIVLYKEEKALTEPQKTLEVHYNWWYLLLLLLPIFIILLEKKKKAKTLDCKKIKE